MRKSCSHKATSDHLQLLRKASAFNRIQHQIQVCHKHVCWLVVRGDARNHHGCMHDHHVDVPGFPTDECERFGKEIKQWRVSESCDRIKRIVMVSFGAWNWIGLDYYILKVRWRKKCKNLIPLKNRSWIKGNIFFQSRKFQRIRRNTFVSCQIPSNLRWMQNHYIIIMSLI